MGGDRRMNKDGSFFLSMAILFLFVVLVLFGSAQMDMLKTRVKRMETATRSTAPITVNIHVTTPKDAQKTLKALLPTLDEMRMIR